MKPEHQWPHDRPDVDSGWWMSGVSPHDTFGEWVPCPFCRRVPPPAGTGWYCRFCLGVHGLYLPVRPLSG